MAIYFINLFSIILFYLFIHMSHIKHKKLLFCIYSFIQLSLISGLRYEQISFHIPGIIRKLWNMECFILSLNRALIC